MQTSNATRATRVPSPVRGAQVLLAVIAISHLTVPIVMLDSCHLIPREGQRPGLGIVVRNLQGTSR